MIIFTGPIYSYPEVDKACERIENILGRNFLKKGIEQIKDSDPSGAGMGRQYGGIGASRLLLYWHGAKEELTFAGLEGYYRPGRNGSIIGSLGEDLDLLSTVADIKSAAAGLLDNNSFETTTLLLWVASRLAGHSKKILFPMNPSGFFLSGGNNNYVFLTYRTSEQYLHTYIKSSLENIEKAVQPIPGETKYIVYVDIPDVQLFIESEGNLLQKSNLFLNDSKNTVAVVLCNTRYHSGTSGVRRVISGYPAVDKKAPGVIKTEGLLVYYQE